MKKHISELTTANFSFGETNCATMTAGVKASKRHQRQAGHPSQSSATSFTTSAKTPSKMDMLLQSAMLSAVPPPTAAVARRVANKHHSHSPNHHKTDGCGHPLTGPPPGTPHPPREYRSESQKGSGLTDASIAELLERVTDDQLLDPVSGTSIRKARDIIIRLRDDLQDVHTRILCRTDEISRAQEALQTGSTSTAACGNGAPPGSSQTASRTVHFDFPETPRNRRTHKNARRMSDDCANRSTTERMKHDGDPSLSKKGRLEDDCYNVPPGSPPSLYPPSPGPITQVASRTSATSVSFQHPEPVPATPVAVPPAATQEVTSDPPKPRYVISVASPQAPTPNALSSHPLKLEVPCAPLWDSTEEACDSTPQLLNYHHQFLSLASILQMSDHGWPPMRDGTILMCDLSCDESSHTQSSVAGGGVLLPAHMSFSDLEPPHVSNSRPSVSHTTPLQERDVNARRSSNAMNSTPLQKLPFSTPLCTLAFSTPADRCTQRRFSGSHSSAKEDANQEIQCRLSVGPHPKPLENQLQRAPLRGPDASELQVAQQLQLQRRFPLLNELCAARRALARSSIVLAGGASDENITVSDTL